MPVAARVVCTAEGVHTCKLQVGEEEEEEERKDWFPTIRGWPLREFSQSFNHILSLSWSATPFLPRRVHDKKVGPLCDCSGSKPAWGKTIGILGVYTYRASSLWLGLSYTTLLRTWTQGIGTAPVSDDFGYPCCERVPHDCPCPQLRGYVSHLCKLSCNCHCDAAGDHLNAIVSSILSAVLSGAGALTLCFRSLKQHEGTCKNASHSLDWN